jgi:hypothetical protein
MKPWQLSGLQHLAVHWPMPSGIGPTTLQQLYC